MTPYQNDCLLPVHWLSTGWESHNCPTVLQCVTCTCMCLPCLSEEAGGTGRLPYQSLVNQGMTIKVAGLPNSLTFKKPSYYGRNQLEAILQAAEEISFEISK